MNILHAPLKELAWFDGAREELKRKGRVLAGGCADAAKPHLVSALCEEIASPLILTWSDRRARELAEEYRQNLLEKVAETDDSLTNTVFMTGKSWSIPPRT